MKCLIERAFKINSTQFGFFQEVNRLKQYFFNNQFPLSSINKTFNKKIQSLQNNQDNFHTVQKKKLYATLPFLNQDINLKITKELNLLMHRFYPHINLNIVFKNNFTIKSFFPYKDVIPTFMLSNIVYKYSCEQCNAAYYGETTRHLKTRVAEHIGIHPRTGKTNPNPLHSSIRNHQSKTGHQIKEENFKVIYKAKNEYEDVRIAESILISKDKPELNTMEPVKLSIIS